MADFKEWEGFEGRLWKAGDALWRGQGAYF